ncbi:hypothetical protein ACYF6T_40285 [Streptomyces sp. 7R007]
MITDVVEMTISGGMRLAPAGIAWDAIKVSRHLGVQAVEQIPHPGAVAVDPAPKEPVLYFFVPAGSAAVWRVPQTKALTLDAHLVLPPDSKEAPPGPYWLVAPSHGLTAIETLRHALTVLQRAPSG